MHTYPKTMNLCWPTVLLLALMCSSCSRIRPLNTGMMASEDPVLATEIEAKKQELNTTVKTDAPIVLTSALQVFCQQVDHYFKKYNWPQGECQEIQWNHVRNSVNNTPLAWMIFGDENMIKNPTTEVTMLMCGVHGDEITPIRFCFDAIQYFKSRQDLFTDRVLIVAPIVNPDSFFMEKPTRTNAHGVDINRNFPTRDWQAKAIRYWRDRYNSDKRRNPGSKPLTEPEVVFQVNLIKRYMPDKILSVHSPLTLLDLDGPEITIDTGDSAIGNAANDLLVQMAKQAKGYKVKNYPFFPGSLGNWAGNERKIPTYTLELPDSDPDKSSQFWELFKDAIHSAVTHPFKLVQGAVKKDESIEFVEDQQEIQ